MREHIDKLKAEYHSAIEGERQSNFFIWANLFKRSDESDAIFEARLIDHRRAVEAAEAELLAEGFTNHLRTKRP